MRLGGASIPLGDGCPLYVDPARLVATLATPANDAGFATLPLSISALDALRGFRLWTQAVAVDPAGPCLGLTFTQGLQLAIGD